MQEQELLVRYRGQATFSGPASIQLWSVPNYSIIPRDMRRSEFLLANLELIDLRFGFRIEQHM